MRAKGLEVTAGDFAENITTRGIDLLTLQPQASLLASIVNLSIVDFHPTPSRLPLSITLAQDILRQKLSLPAEADGAKAQADS